MQPSPRKWPVHRRIWIALAAGVMLSAALALAASGSRAGVTGGPHPLSNLLPANISVGSTVKVPAEIDYAPFEFYTAKHVPEGLDVDILTAVGRELGIKFQFVNQTFASIIPALQNGRYDVADSSFSDTSDREKQATFIDYLVDGDLIAVKKGNPEHIKNGLSLCGKNVAVVSGDIAIQLANQMSTKCKAQGKAALNQSVLTTTAATLLAISSGRADATLIDAAPAAYTLKHTSNAYELIPPILNKGPYGIVVRKDEQQLAKAIHAALGAIKKNGTYDKILTKWNETTGEMSQFYINGAGKFGA